MRSRTGWGLVPCLLLVAILAIGCGREPGQVVSHWTLDVPGAASRTIDLPLRLEGELPDRISTYRLSATVDLDRTLVGHDVELVLAYLPALASLRVDGQDARLVGDPEPASAYGGGAPRRWLLPSSATRAGAPPVTLELEVTHRWSPSARFDVAPELVAVGSASPRAERNRLVNEQGAWFGLIALSQVGITFLAVFFWDRRRHAYLWFAIQALTASYYPAYVAGLPAPWLGWQTEHMLLAQSLAVAPIISVYFTHAFFGLRRPNRVWLVLLGVAMLSPVTVLVASQTVSGGFLDTSYSSVIVAVCVLSAIVYQLTMGVRLLGSYPDRGSVVFFLCCWLALGGSSWVDLLAWVGGPEILSGARPACIGLGFFGIFQSMLLGRSHFRSLVEAEGLNERLRGQVNDLEERQSEIETLNEELQRQIGRRTADILAAVAGGDPGAKLSLEPGDVIEARYRVIASLGVGGMGAVYEVERLSDGRRLALKMTQEVRGVALARLAREARIATRIHHPNVVSVVDADVTEGGHAFLVMELVEGRSLAECSKGRDVPWILAVLIQVLGGVKALHEQGIIHRDLKPSNILIAGDARANPHVKITDFGISRWLGDEPLDPEATPYPGRPEQATVRTPGAPQRMAPIESKLTISERSSGSLTDPRSAPQLTHAGLISGTPPYVAPELAEGTALLSPAVDVFSFGVVAYVLLTGKQPFVEPPFLVRLDGREIPRPAPLASLTSGVSDELAAALDACLAPTPAERPGVDALLLLLQPTPR